MQNLVYNGKLLVRIAFVFGLLTDSSFFLVLDTRQTPGEDRETTTGILKIKTYPHQGTAVTLDTTGEILNQHILSSFSCFFL